MFPYARREIVVVSLLALVACDPTVIDLTGEPSLFEVRHDAASGNLWVTVYPGLAEGHTLHMRVTNQRVGGLDCALMSGQIPRIDGQPISLQNGHTFRGPAVNAGDFQNPYDITWLESEPTRAQIGAANAQTRTIQLCQMNGSEVVRSAEMDIARALDIDGTGKFDGPYDEEIKSVVAYARACEYELGANPFFPRLATGDYATYSCLDSTPIPTVVTSEDGTARLPRERSDTCDDPQFIYSLCEPNAVSGQTNGPRVASRQNIRGTHWVILCRKSKDQEGEYNDIAMIGHNPYTGKTCFFQNALYSRTDGLHIPDPADEVDSPASPQQSASLWSGIQGGIGRGIECGRCHDSDAFIHTPWIDGAKDERGDPIIPQLGIDDGFVLGFNEAPYSLVDQVGQGWTMPKMLASPEAAPCTKCHRIGNGRWAKSWLERLEGANEAWEGKLTEVGKTFAHAYWMPPETEGIDASTWAASEFGEALDFIQFCSKNPDDATCTWADLPVEQSVNVGKLPEITLEGAELATEAAKILGARVTDAADPRCTGEGGLCTSRRCAECHSVSRAGLKHWRDLTRAARENCGLNRDPAEMTPEEAMKAVNCVRVTPEESSSVFAADKVGILVTGARYGYFRQLFQKAFGDQAWLTEYVLFKSRVSMPKGMYAALSQQEYATLVKWFDQDLNNIDVIQDPPPPTSLESFVDGAWMQSHIEEMKYDGWGAVNAEAGIHMWACEDGSPAAKCFGSAPDRTAEWGHADGGQLREVLKLDFRTSFWTRSSADGRFIGNGGKSGGTGSATITDLQRSLNISVKSTYDPGFFPDNSGFIFQGGGTGICTQSILETATEIDYTEPGCIRGTNINLYQHVARGIGGGDYFIINSQFTSDSGRSKSTDPVAHFNAESTMKFSPMVFGGLVYEQLPAVIVESPYEGDSVLSPSSRLVISRLAGGKDNGPLGYVVRAVKAERQGDNYDISIERVVGKYPMSGAKANISFDERFFVTHHYEPGGTANVFLVNMLDGAIHQVTQMPTGAKALFPHFRSDGWFYFLVRAGDEEYVVANDLAVTLGK